MDSFASDDRKLSELGTLDLQDLLDQSDLFDDHDEQLDAHQRTGRRRRRDDTAAADCVSSDSHPRTIN